MGEHSKIEWTDHTFNSHWGCVKVSPACENCYAETFDKRVHGLWGPSGRPQAPRRFFGDKHWAEPLRWDRKAAEEGVRRRVFCSSMADVFEDRADLVPVRTRLWSLILETPHLDWLLLTKRPENFVKLPWMSGGTPDQPWPNVWLGVTAENQEWVDRRLPMLCRTPAAVRFVSAEPLLGPVDLTPYLAVPTGNTRTHRGRRQIDWVICGGESGPRGRPMSPAWARGLRDQCQQDGVAFFFKQWGEHGPDLLRLGKKNAGRELDGRTWDEVPR